MSIENNLKKTPQQEPVEVSEEDALHIERNDGGDASFEGTFPSIYAYLKELKQTNSKKLKTMGPELEAVLNTYNTELSIMVTGSSEAPSPDELIAFFTKLHEPDVDTVLFKEYIDLRDSALVGFNEVIEKYSESEEGIESEADRVSRLQEEIRTLGDGPETLEAVTKLQEELATLQINLAGENIENFNQEIEKGNVTPAVLESTKRAFDAFTNKFEDAQLFLATSFGAGAFGSFLTSYITSIVPHRPGVDIEWSLRQIESIRVMGTGFAIIAGALLLTGLVTKIIQNRNTVGTQR